MEGTKLQTGREIEGRTKNTLKGHSGAWKIKTKTQRDMIQRT